MSSRAGPRAVGTDGTDFRHRQRVAEKIKMSVQYKFYLKALFGIHLMVLCAMWAKVGGEVLFNELKLFDEVPSIWRRFDLPSAYPWEYVWCFSFIPIILALCSFPRNKANLLSYHYYGQFTFGILPCAIGLGSQFPELIDYIRFGEKSETPTFNGHFPMVILWYLFFLVAFQIHGFSMYFSYFLNASWQRDMPLSQVENNLNSTEQKKAE